MVQSEARYWDLLRRPRGFLRRVRKYSIQVAVRDENEQSVRIMVKEVHEIECEGFNTDA